jgi:hypothetical protein
MTISKDRLRTAYSDGAFSMETLVEVSGSKARDSFKKLRNKDERREMLNGIANNIDIKANRWVDFYEAIKLVEENDWYWKERGYEGFQPFLKATIGTSLEQWRELEDLYNYAKVACPQLFSIDDATVAKMTRKMESISPANKDKVKKPADALRDQMTTALKQPTVQGQFSLERVVARVKRDRPDVIAAAMEELKSGKTGNFVKEDSQGNMTWSVSALLNAAGTEDRADQKKRLQATTIDTRMADLLKKAESVGDRQKVLKVLRSVKWIRDGMARQ